MAESPDSFNRRWQRAGKDTPWFRWRWDLLPVVAGSLGTGYGAYALQHAQKGFAVSAVIIPAVAGIAALLVYFVLLHAVEFAWHFAVAGYKNRIDDLELRLAKPDEAHRSSVAFQKHVQNLQDLAISFKARLQPGTTVDLSGPLGRSFQVHFPEVAAKLTQWNDRRYHDLYGQFQQLLSAEDLRVLPEMPGRFSGLLRRVAIDDPDLNNLTWSVRDGQVVVQVANNGFMLGLPIETFSAEKLGRRLQAMGDTLAAVGHNPTVREWNAITHAYVELEKALSDELETITRTHGLRGVCDLCLDLT